MTTADLVAERHDGPVDERSTTTSPTSGSRATRDLPLSYRFEPGAEDDGVTVQVPLALLARLQPNGFDWQVPGLRDELVTALIKSLPKAIRRNVVPAADWARKLMEDAPAEGSEDTTLTRVPRRPDPAHDLHPGLGRRLRSRPGARPPQVTFVVLDERGRPVARSKDLAGLQHKLKTRSRDSVAHALVHTPHALERDGLTAWDFDRSPTTSTRHWRATPSAPTRRSSITAHPCPSG